MADKNKNEPEKNFKLGSVGCAVWLNHSKKENRPFFTVSGVTRTYMNEKTGKLDSTSTLRVSDLPDAVIVLQQAYLFVKEKTKELNKKAKEEDEDDEDDDEEDD